jgi:SAM-dependent methyltransferase
MFVALPRWGITPELALGVASALGVATSLLGDSWWRRVMIGLGFPLSLLLTQAASLPAWVWLVPLLALLLIYPLNAWRDAPLFPTPRHALKDLAAQVSLASGALILDAGCGLGDGLKALRAAYPQAQLTGIEWSWPLCALCSLRCPWATVCQGDIWVKDWSGFDMVYLFQRPESMPRAAAKANAELKPGAWLVSLEFEAQTLHAHTVLRTVQGKPVWVYRAPFQAVKEHP